MAESAIVVVDDEPHVGELLSRIFEVAGYTTHVAHTGVKGRQLIESKAARLLVLDVMLPDINGVDFCASLREAGWQGRVLMLSAAMLSDARMRAFQAGCNAVGAKPFHAPRLLELIGALQNVGEEEAAAGIYAVMPLPLSSTHAKDRVVDDLWSLTALSQEAMEGLAGDLTWLLTRLAATGLATPDTRLDIGYAPDRLEARLSTNNGSTSLLADVLRGARSSPWTPTSENVLSLPFSSVLS